VFTNIILNARQAMSEKGILKISANNRRLKEYGFIGLLPEPYSRFELLSVVKAAPSTL
jgi:hypothetical protein